MADSEIHVEGFKFGFLFVILIARTSRVFHRDGSVVEIGTTIESCPAPATVEKRVIDCLAQIRKGQRDPRASALWPFFPEFRSFVTRHPIKIDPCIKVGRFC